MFGDRWGNRRAWAWQGAEESQGHHDRHHGHHKHWHGHEPHSPFEAMIMRMARRFPFGPGRHGGDAPFFGRGDLKYGLLELLLERPKHGYEMIKELEDKAGGFYTPSAGAVYPALQLMEDREWITSQTIEGKKVYTITDAGKNALKEHQQDREHLHGPGGPRGFGWGGPGMGRGPFGHEARPEMHALQRETMEVARLLWMAAVNSGGDLTKLGQLRKIIENTREQLATFMNDNGEEKRKNDDSGEVKF